MTSDAVAGEGSGGEAIHFQLQDNERVVQTCRKHWMYLWPRTLLWLAFALVPVAVLNSGVAWLDQYDGLTRTVIWIISALWLAFWAVRLFLNWYKYHNDVWVITNQRIVDSVKNHPFDLQISTADLVNVQDMTVRKRGPLRTIFNYGDIVCETASGSRDFVLAGIPRPEDVQMLVDRERDRERMRYR
jgi:membrane protein YdbS with pleckstrin-like domain